MFTAPSPRIRVISGKKKGGPLDRPCVASVSVRGAQRTYLPARGTCSLVLPAKRVASGASAASRIGVKYVELALVIEYLLSAGEDKRARATLQPRSVVVRLDARDPGSSRRRAIALDATLQATSGTDGRPASHGPAAHRPPHQDDRLPGRRSLGGSPRRSRFSSRRRTTRHRVATKHSRASITICEPHDRYRRRGPMLPRWLAYGDATHVIVGAGRMTRSLCQT